MRKLQLMSLATLMALFIAGCAGSGKLLQKGEYDAAIDKSVKKLMKHPDNVKEIKTLKKAWEIANNDDLDKINKLQLLQQPGIWKDIYYAYERLDKRQRKVERLPDNVLSEINFVKRDYSAQTVEALKKSALYSYNTAVKLLETDDKYNARKAYDELVFIKNHLGNYKDIDKYINKALEKGTTRVLFVTENQSETVLPKNYEEQILKMSLSKLNDNWLEFYTWPEEGVYYDYEIDLLIKEIEVSPEQVSREKYTDTKRVEDGWQYVLDENGNVKKDSAGNDIKIRKYKTLKAFVTKVDMFKQARVRAVLDYYDAGGQLLKTYPLTSEFVFEHHFATFEGDAAALSKKSHELVKRGAVPFPKDEEIIFDTSDDLKQKAFNLIRKDKRLFD